MKTRFCLLAAGLLAVAIPALKAYEEKDDPAANAPQKEEAGANLKLKPKAPRSATATNEEAFPYYANTPEEMLPYKTVEPFYRYWLKRLPFRGPGADYPDPTDLKSLKVGLLSPSSYGPEGKRGARTKRGVEMAFEEANATRPKGQLPFEIVYREDSPQWGSAANIAVEFADNEVLGFLGTVDGDATHVALRATLKLETYMINTSDPDPTLTETQIPWLTRVFPDDRQQCMHLAELAVKKYGCKRIVVLRESSRPGRVGVMHFVNYIRRLGFPPIQHLLYKPGESTFSAQMQAIQASEPDAVLLYGQPSDIGRAAAVLRKLGVHAKIFGFDRLHDPEFAREAGDAAEGTIITYFFDPEKTDKPWADFRERFEKRYGEKADIYAGYGYDGAKLMIQAIDKVGPNRVRVRDYLANLESYDGVTGHMRFDARWDNIAPISIAQFKQGKWVFEPRENASGKSDQARLNLR